MIHLNEHAGIPLYRQLYQQLRQEIAHGELPAGSRLPSRRKLSEQLCISVNTVDTAYVQLEAEGFVEARPRQGYFVLETGASPALSGAAQPLYTGDRPESQPKDSAQAVLVDFSPGGMARRQFPMGSWRRLIRTCFNEYDESLLLRTPAQGDPGLRSRVAEYLYRARGVQCTPEQIIIGAGTDSLLMLLGYILSSRYTVAAENPIYNQAPRLFRRFGHSLCPVPVGPAGISTEDLPSGDNILVYTTPSHQYPLGYAMPIGQRNALLRWSAAQPHRYIIEDDYDSEFRYESRPVPSLQSIDSAGRVIYLGTFSRSIAPALRISYMVLPEALLQLYRESYSGFSTTVSGLEQAVLREFLASGEFDRHVSRMRVYYRARRRCLVDALAALDPQPELLGVPAGHHLTLTLHNGMTEQTLTERACACGVRVYPVSPYFMGPVPAQYRSTVLLGYGGLEDDAIREGCRLLKQAWG